MDTFKTWAEADQHMLIGHGWVGVRRDFRTLAQVSERHAEMHNAKEGTQARERADQHQHS